MKYAGILFDLLYAVYLVAIKCEILLGTVHTGEVMKPN